MRACEFIMMLRGAVVRSCPRPAAASNDAGDPHRREILIKLLAAALTTVTGRSGLAATLPLGRDRFLEVSEKLCAMSIDDRALAECESVQAAPPGPLLPRTGELAARIDADLDALWTG